MPPIATADKWGPYCGPNNERCDPTDCIDAAQDWGDPPPSPPPRRAGVPVFRPWQQVWQCNDIRVTITVRDPDAIEYHLGGMMDFIGPPAIAYSRVGTGRTPSAVPSNSNSPASHSGLEHGLIAQSC